MSCIMILKHSQIISQITPITYKIKTKNKRMNKYIQIQIAEIIEYK